MAAGVLAGIVSAGIALVSFIRRNKKPGEIKTNHPNLNAIDYVASDKRNEWMVYEAAFLWNDLEPPSVEAHGALMNGDVSNTKNMLHAAIEAGELICSKELRSAFGVTRYVSRKDLMQFAETKDEKPGFLFPNQRHLYTH